MTDLKSIPSHSPDVITRKTGNEYVLVPIANNIADMNNIYTLNESGAFIWELIDGEKNLEDITVAVTEEYDIDKETALSDVNSFIDKLKHYLIIK